MGAVLHHGARKERQGIVIVAESDARDRGIVLCDCTVWTGDDSRIPVKALALKGEEIYAIGEAALSQPSSWPRISLRGAAVLPGLIDSHVHLTTAAKRRLQLPLDHCSSIRSLLERVRKWADAHPDDEWIVGSGWDDSGWRSSGMLSRHQLDAVVPERPVCLVRRDRHSAVLNSPALSLFRRFEGASPALAPRDDDGELSGIVREGLLDEVSQHLPPVSSERALEALAEEQRHLWSFGIIGVHSIERKAGLELLEELHRRERLGLRLYVSADGLSAQECREWCGGIVIQGKKWYVDGSLGSDTAWLFSPDQTTVGVALIHGEDLKSEIEEALELGLNPHVHAIGDRAVREVLDVCEPLLRAYPFRFFRIEHVQHIDKADLVRLRHHNMLLSVQPCHLLGDRATLGRVARRTNRLDYAYGSMMTHGGMLIMGTDYPIEPVDPWRNIRAAVNRRDDEEPGDQSEALPWLQVLSAYSRLPALSAGWHESGQLLPGRKADLIVVDPDAGPQPTSCRHVELTMLNGQIVHSTGSMEFP